jgi:hypothetical protein
MIRFEDNQSLRAMAGQEDLHVGFTRHRATARMFVESIEVLREIASRSRRDQPTATRLTPTESARIARMAAKAPDRTFADRVNAQVVGLFNKELANTDPQPSLRLESRDLVKRHCFTRERDQCRLKTDTRAGIQESRIQTEEQA